MKKNFLLIFLTSIIVVSGTHIFSASADDRRIPPHAYPPDIMYPFTQVQFMLRGKKVIGYYLRDEMIPCTLQTCPQAAIHRFKHYHKLYCVRVYKTKEEHIDLFVAPEAVTKLTNVTPAA